MTTTPSSPANGGERAPVSHMPLDFLDRLDAEVELAGGEVEEAPEYQGAIGRTMFDTPASKDHTVTVLLPADAIGKVPSQSLVRIKSRPAANGGDGRQYLGAVVQGPFAEPDGLRADAPIVVTTTVRGAMFMPKYHGRVQVEIIGEELDDTLQPPRFRPLPNSPVFPLTVAETRTMLGLESDIDLGLAVGFEHMAVQFPARRKSVLPRHVGVLGTTGGGKSTTVSGLVAEFQRTGIATILVDTEGEYTDIGKPTEDRSMIKLLARMGKQGRGVPGVSVYHLVERGTTAAAPTPIAAFRVDFSSLSPYAAAEIMDLSEAQTDRFFKAYDTTKLVLRDLGIYPAKDSAAEARAALELNEFETGYPRMTLSHLIDVAGFFLAQLTKTEAEPFNAEFRSGSARGIIAQRVAQVQTNHEISWKALLGKLWRLQRTKVFDNKQAAPMPFASLIRPGAVSIVDLSDTDSTIINNLVISNILRGIQLQQEEAYVRAEASNQEPTPVMIIIEEAHEFLSRDRIAKMHNLFEQVARIARRGRKRWTGLMFVTQLPQHLPDEVLGLLNNFILHKITDANVISRLKRTIGGIDEGLWDYLPSLAPGQAVVSMSSMTRPMLVAVNPTPCKLKMID